MDRSAKLIKRNPRSLDRPQAYPGKQGITCKAWEQWVQR